jgi:hypothetical protein
MMRHLVMALPHWPRSERRIGKIETRSFRRVEKEKSSRMIEKSSGVDRSFFFSFVREPPKMAGMRNRPQRPDESSG